MKELLYIEKIKRTLSDSSYLGDDCAYFSPDYIKNKGLYFTQDSLVEGIHFSLDFIDAYQLGKKAINVNLSDLAAMCAEPAFVTISLSLSDKVDEKFVEDFYKGVNEVCERHNIVVAGGDITGADRVFVSVCAAGRRVMSYSVSRSFAEPGDIVAVSGFHGDSAGGLKMLVKDNTVRNSLVDAHINPSAQIEKSSLLADTVKCDFAMMDSSDGLADALYKISEASNVKMNIDFSEIPVNDCLKKTFPDEYKDLVLWGGEDYQLVFCINPNDFKKLDSSQFFKIGVVEKTNESPAVYIKDFEKIYVINKKAISEKSYNHFGMKKVQ